MQQFYNRPQTPTARTPERPAHINVSVVTLKRPSVMRPRSAPPWAMADTTPVYRPVCIDCPDGTRTTTRQKGVTGNALTNSGVRWDVAEVILLNHVEHHHDKSVTPETLAQHGDIKMIPRSRRIK